MDKNIKGISILESLVCLVIIGIGFVAMLQLSSFSINVADRTIEKNKSRGEYHQRTNCNKRGHNKIEKFDFVI